MGALLPTLRQSLEPEGCLVHPGQAGSTSPLHTPFPAWDAPIFDTRSSSCPLKPSQKTCTSGKPSVPNLAWTCHGHSREEPRARNLGDTACSRLFIAQQLRSREEAMSWGHRQGSVQGGDFMCSLGQKPKCHLHATLSAP